MRVEKTAISLLKMFGHAVLGNLMGVIVSFSVAAFFGGTAAGVTASVFSFALYHMMILSAAYKGGFHEKKLLRAKVIEQISKKKWVNIGVATGVIMLVPIIVYMAVGGVGNDSYTLIFRFVCGANFSAVMWLPPAEYSFAPFIYMIVYILTPLSSLLGYNLAFNENLTMDKIIYKSRK